MTIKQKVAYATSLSKIVLFGILAGSKIPFIFFSAFTLLLASAIKMWLDFTKDDEDINENQPIENGTKLFVLRLVMQLFPTFLIFACFFILSLKEEFWKQFFRN